MTTSHANLADAALPLLGAPFRLGGRDPVLGLDCVGLIIAALANTGRKVASMPEYSLRQYNLAQFYGHAKAVGLEPVGADTQRGDVLLLQPSPSQFHLAISLTDRGIIHAHALLRRVVVTPLPMPWPTLRRWRLA